jgi:hypothetical protein
MGSAYKGMGATGRLLMQIGRHTERAKGEKAARYTELFAWGKRVAHGVMTVTALLKSAGVLLGFGRFLGDNAHTHNVAHGVSPLYKSLP